MSDLQALLDATPPGGRLDLGARRFDLETSLEVHGPVTIVGAGASIVMAPSPLRNLPVVLCYGEGIKLHGAVYVSGAKPVGAAYASALEAQHGIELAGVSDFLCDGWRIENTRGDAIYIGKSGSDRWSRNVVFTHISTNEIGRQHCTLDAVHTVRIDHFVFGMGYRSVIDIEPPGHDWGATDVTITEGLVTSPGGFLLSSKGVGTTNSVKNIHLSYITCKGRGVDARVLPPAGVRRAGISITNCTSDFVTQSTQLRFTSVDGLTIAANMQPVSRGIPPVSAVDCTAVNITNNAFAPSTTPPRIV